MIRLWLISTMCLAGMLASTRSALADGEANSRPQYNRDVRPILSDKCFRCHGHDSAQRQAGLRLDRRDDALAEHDGQRAIVPGKPSESELFARITAADPDEHMPPASSGQTLSAQETNLLKQWIAEGAEYQPHWSFIPPKSPALPAVSEQGWIRNPIDAFVLAGLDQQGFKHSPQAAGETLLRRVTLDLTGLPPTPAELDAFLADASPEAYDRAVDRLLTSPRYGERLALDWLDAARYADTNGYYLDSPRQVWPWRDWVLNAFNRNMPFDQFTIEQLAGDLLPQATPPQQIATGFNRNHMTTNESGIIDEEYRIGYVVDRVDTTSTVWLGLTLGCARCHDHKYDPISQREYYELFACFNTVDEKGLIKAVGNPPPVLALPTPEQERHLAELAERRAKCEADLRKALPNFNAALAAWEKNATASLAEVTTAGCVAHFDFDQDAGDHSPLKLASKSVGTLEKLPGITGSGLLFEGTQYVEFDGAPVPDADKPFSLSIWIMPGNGPQGCVVSKMGSTVDSRGFDVMWYKQQPRINLSNVWGRSRIEVVAKQTFPAKEWHHLAISYDGSSQAAGLKVYVDGQPQALIVRRDDLHGSIATDAPWQIAWKGNGVGFEGALDELRLYDRPLEAGEVEAMYWHDMLTGAISRPIAERTRQQKEQLRSYFIAHHASPESRQLVERMSAARREEEAVKKEILSAPVMHEMSQPRATHVLVRGQYDHPSETVTAGTPASLGKMSVDLPRNRLGFARWLVSPEHPLTARVAVNRYWQLIFGDGLVRTVNDFGLQGEPPSNPELLDWLAVDFVRSGWDVKRLLKLMVTSATYRQSSNFTPELLAHDPENRLLARGPRYRLSAELVRDQALALGGLLVEKLGGPSVRPYQPAGLWEAVSYNGDQSYEQDHGESLYRRSVYTFWKRQAPPPALLTFDGPTRETCTVRRARTNTPLQALVLLNDVTYVEAARGLATQMMQFGGNDPGECIKYGFRRATGAAPKASEIAVLQKFYEQQLADYRQRPDAAAALLRIGEAPIDAKLDPVELAAWTMTAATLLNMDETITQH